MTLTPRDHALRVAVLKTLQDEVAAVYKSARAEAEAVFARTREDGQTQQKVMLPDSSEIGLISVREGTRHADPKNAEIQAWVAEHLPDDTEDYIIPVYLTHPDIIAWVKARFPEAVASRIRPATKEALLKAAADNDGYVIDEASGDKAQIAEVSTGKPTGAFSYRPGPDARKKIIAAWRAGELGGIGLGVLEITGPDETPEGTRG